MLQHCPIKWDTLFATFFAATAFGFRPRFRPRFGLQSSFFLSSLSSTFWAAAAAAAAGGIAGIDRGLAAGLAEYVKLAGRLDLHIGDTVVGDEDIGHGPRHGDEFTAADRQYDFRAGPCDRLGGGDVGRNAGHGRERQAGEQHFGSETTFHGIAP